MECSLALDLWARYVCVELLCYMIHMRPGLKSLATLRYYGRYIRDSISVSYFRSLPRHKKIS